MAHPHWLYPLPLGDRWTAVAEWRARGIPESRVDVDARAIHRGRRLPRPALWGCHPRPRSGARLVPAYERLSGARAGCAHRRMTPTKTPMDLRPGARTAWGRPCVVRTRRCCGGWAAGFAVMATCSSLPGYCVPHHGHTRRRPADHLPGAERLTFLRHGAAGPGGPERVHSQRPAVRRVNLEIQGNYRVPACPCRPRYDWEGPDHVWRPVALHPSSGGGRRSRRPCSGHARAPAFRSRRRARPSSGDGDRT